MARMKGIGTEDKKKVAVAAGLGLVVLALAAHTIFGGPSSPSTPVAPVQPASLSVATPAPAAGRAGAAGASGAAAAANASIDPALHPELMAENENYLYAGNGRNIFSQSSGPPPSTAIEKVKGPVRPSAEQIAANLGPPQPPAIDLRFFGYAARHNGTRRAFLLHGDDVFVASEGDVVSHRYRVVQIAPFSIQIEDLPYHNTQTLPLVQVQN